MLFTEGLVSIVIPTYNRARFIGQAVTSALNQTYRELEVIVVDDGSTDNTQSILSTFEDTRLQIVRLEKNSGRSRARNIALRAARGEYMSFLDSDDYYLPGKIELQVKYLKENPAIDMVYTASACVDENDASLDYFYRAPVSGDIYKEIAFFKPLTITLPTVMLRRHVVDEVGLFDEAMDRFEDTDYWRRISKRFRVGAIDEVTCHIRTHKGNHIKSLDPRSFVSSINYYVDKVFREDADIDPLVLGAGARRLYEHYGIALASVPGAKESSSELLTRGLKFFHPLVSIVIPVYNGANFLEQAIKSALAQTYGNIEVVVVNDGSTDGGATEKVARAFGDRIRYFSKSNGGCASALNVAIREARGSYISWLSHDDLYVEEKIEKQIEFLALQSDPGSCIVYGDYSPFSGPKPLARRPSSAMPATLPENFRFFLTTQNILHGCSLIIPKLALERHGLFDETLKTVLDFDLWFKLATTERFLCLPGVVVYARAHADQDTNRKREIHMKEANELLARFVEELSEDEIHRGSSYNLIHGYYYIAQTLRQRNFDAAAEHAVMLAERVGRTLLLPNGPAVESRAMNNGPLPACDALDDLFAIARNWTGLDRLQTLTEESSSVAVTEESSSVAVKTSLNWKARIVNSRLTRHLARDVVRSRNVQFLLRRLVGYLPIAAQIRMQSIWRQIKSSQ
jgi:glycosyltransferase involved in cell wall biosynthesis